MWTWISEQHHALYRALKRLSLQCESECVLVLNLSIDYIRLTSTSPTSLTWHPPPSKNWETHSPGNIIADCIVTIVACISMLMTLVVCLSERDCGRVCNVLNLVWWIWSVWAAIDSHTELHSSLICPYQSLSFVSAIPPSIWRDWHLDQQRIKHPVSEPHAHRVQRSWGRGEGEGGGGSFIN